MTWLPIPPEAARPMCLSVDCPSSATCALHEDSGTKPHERQTHTVRFPQPDTGRCAAYRAHPDLYGRAPIIMIQRTKNDLRQAIQSEGTPRIQDLWDRLEQWIDSPPMMDARHD